KTPIQFAADIGLLAPNAILGHAIFVDQHSWMHWWSRRDIALIAENGATVAHCPTVFSRYGQTLENFGLYRRAGINMALGTDVSPHNMLEEMRNAAILARVSGQDIAAGTTAEVFHAATIGGATALGRDDIGRLAPGCKADLVVVDLSDVNMVPARDPLRSLMYTAAERAVKDVYVDGIKVVSDRKVLTMDRAEAAAGVAEAQVRMIEAVPELDYAGRTAEQISPLSLPIN
ncbi:MAG: amidohydrolase family protein, partial [Gammaproteobacteria bacterium]